ncbi:MAG: alpha/beta hydrolase [Microscillaceae bacterium]|nr:alpha/beta hydrolase [Microscillaceae bacterium]MDW8460846.1 alpha/beta fold hydrolase [Cytophagales bacterium]
MRIKKFWIAVITGLPFTLYFVFCLFFYFFQECFLFLPKKLDANFKFRFPYLYQEVNLQSSDNEAVLNNLWFKVPNSKGVVLFFHGNAGNLARWGSMAQDFCRRGFDVFIHDYRTYGKSTGSLSQENLFSDAQLCYDFIKKQYKNKKVPIIIYGRSIGTGVATYLASKNETAKLILETPYNNMKDLINTYTKLIPTELLLRFSLPSDEYIAEVKCPVYILHGTQDETVPYILGKKLAERAGKKAKFYTIQEGEHNNLATFATYQAYLDRILAK